MSPELAQKAEQVVDTYKRIFDKDLSYRKAGCTEEEAAALEQDPEFQSRLEIFLINEKERIYGNLTNLMTSGDTDAIRLKATQELGRIIYPKRFIEGYNEETGVKELGKLTVEHEGLPPKVELDADTAATVLGILEASSALKPAAKGTTSSEADEIHNTRANA